MGTRRSRAIWAETQQEVGQSRHVPDTARAGPVEGIVDSPSLRRVPSLPTNVCNPYPGESPMARMGPSSLSGIPGCSRGAAEFILDNLDSDLRSIVLLSQHGSSGWIKAGGRNSRRGLSWITSGWYTKTSAIHGLSGAGKAVYLSAPARTCARMRRAKSNSRWSRPPLPSWPSFPGDRLPPRCGSRSP